MSLIQAWSHLEPFSIQDQLPFNSSAPNDKVIANTSGVGIFLLALKEKQKIPEHSPLGDALLQVLEGRVQVIANEKLIVLIAVQALVITSGATRSIYATESAKLLVTLVKPSGSQKI